jgi:hypothetical protein
MATPNLQPVSPFIAAVLTYGRRYIEELRLNMLDRRVTFFFLRLPLTVFQFITSFGRCMAML